MWYLTRAFCAITIVLTCCGPAYAEEGFLVLHVSNPKGQPIPGVVLSTKGDGSTGPATSSEGKTRLKLAPQTKSNSEVSLQIVKAPTALVFVSPWDGRVRVPPFENESQNFTSVILIEPGDRAWLEYGVVALALVSKVNAANSFRAGADTLTEEQRIANLNEVAKSYGLRPEEVDEAIRAFGKKTIDPFGLGQVALYERNYLEAEKQLLLSKEARKKNLEHAVKEFADVNRSLGQTFYEQGKYKEAVDAYQEVISLRPDDTDALNNLGVALAAIGDYDRAELNCRKALLLDEEKLGPNHPAVATSLTNLAALYEVRGDYVRAEAQYKRALNITQKIYQEGHPLAITLLDNLTQLYLKMGSQDKAIALQESINEIIERHLANVNESESANLYTNTLSGEINQAVSLHMRYAANNYAALRLAFTTVLRNKGRLIDIKADQMKALRSSADPQDQALLEQLLAARSQLASLIFNMASSKSTELNQSSINEIGTKVQQLEEAIRVRTANIISQAEPITLESVQKEIPPEAVLIEFVRYRPISVKKNALAETADPPRYVAYLMRREGAPQCVDLGDAVPIDEDIRRFRSVLQDPSSPDVRTVARALDEKVMRPVRKMLGFTEHFIISPDGLLNLVPFSALIDEQGKYLVEDHLISYLTSGRYLLRLKTHAISRSGPVVIADRLFESREGGSNKMSTVGFSRLPASRREAQAISAMAPDYTEIIGGFATEEVLKQLHGPTYLHLATHGFFLQLPRVMEHSMELSADNTSRAESIARSKLLLRAGPDTLRIGANNFIASGQVNLSLYEDYQLSRSGLALAGANSRQGAGISDGILTALEAMGLDLVGTKLVVLSAAYTGVGAIKDGDGVYGFRRALEVAGAESTITSLWAISDEATSTLMQRYYVELYKGEGRAQGLRKAQLYMLAQEQSQHPLYWAAFIQAGDWR